MFKVGDKVRSVADHFDELIKNEIYTIIEITSDGWYRVVNELSTINGYTSSHFELVAKPEDYLKACTAYYITEPWDYSMPTTDVCQCGAHKLGLDKHADWCQLYKEER